MDGAYIVRQDVETFALTNKEFEQDYRVEVADPSDGFLPGVAR